MLTHYAPASRTVANVPTTASRRPRKRHAVKGKAVRWIHTMTTD